MRMTLSRWFALNSVRATISAAKSLRLRKIRSRPWPPLHPASCNPLRIDSDLQRATLILLYSQGLPQCARLINGDPRSIGLIAFPIHRSVQLRLLNVSEQSFFGSALPIDRGRIAHKRCRVIDGYQRITNFLPAIPCSPSQALRGRTPSSPRPAACRSGIRQWHRCALQRKCAQLCPFANIPPQPEQRHTVDLRLLIKVVDHRSDFAFNRVIAAVF